MPDIWETPERDSGLLALQLAISLRDNQHECFLDVHHALYEHRHNGGGSLTNKDVLRDIITSHGGNPDMAFDDVSTGRPLKVVADEHMRYVKSHQVWGVPVFIVGDKAVFVRLLERSQGDASTATSTINRVLDNIDWPILNEFKHTSVPQ
jgi:protein-disulfide isomerase-like protein with CxxC motif